MPSLIGYTLIMMKRIFPILAILIACTAHSEEKCTLVPKPSENETAFVPVGAPINSADRHCVNYYLEIKKDQKLGAVNIPQGLYPKISQNQEGWFFSTKNSLGDKINTCIWCDRLQAIMVQAKTPHSLCVISYLGAKSCINSVWFSIEHRDVIQGKQCIPSLVYSGRYGNKLNFAVDDCSTKTSAPNFVYDLNFGSMIRFLDERYEILNADNEGIYYRRVSNSTQDP